MVPSKEEEIMPQNTPDIPIHDFISKEKFINLYLIILYLIK